MEIFQRIAAQMAAVALPLYAVSLTAVPRADTPVLLFLHWHGFRRAGARAALRPVPGSALQLNDRWQALEEIDAAMLEAGWRLGAWDVEREEHRACTRVGASSREALECLQAFGEHTDRQAAEALLLAEAPDREALLQVGAEKGFVRWQFRPVRGGLWAGTPGDETLCADGSRTPPCPVAPRPASHGGRGERPVRRTVYRLGRITRLILP
ncbi:diguanylate cyclase [Thiobacter aerophilum]|uniref:Diguanylate cyclase n=1 Tax=Thiobacter aerophilum TaxID=3121275 RepID=A0ABV0EK18_9BURK